MNQYCEYGFDYNRTERRNPAVSATGRKMLWISLEALRYFPAADRLEIVVHTYR
jgi:hypothetical protein